MATEQDIAEFANRLTAKRAEYDESKADFDAKSAAAFQAAASAEAARTATNRIASELAALDTEGEQLTQEYTAPPQTPGAGGEPLATKTK